MTFVIGSGPNPVTPFVPTSHSKPASAAPERAAEHMQGAKHPTAGGAATFSIHQISAASSWGAGGPFAETNSGSVLTSRDVFSLDLRSLIELRYEAAAKRVAETALERLVVTKSEDSATSAKVAAVDQGNPFGRMSPGGTIEPTGVKWIDELSAQRLDRSA